MTKPFNVFDTLVGNRVLQAADVLALLPALPQVAQVVLTSAQVLALFTTPINIIPAPAAGQLILVQSVSYKGTGAYTQADGAGLVYHGTSVGADQSYITAADPFINGTTLTGGIDANTSVGSAIGLGVDIASITTNPTVGTTPVTVTVTYTIITP